MRGGVTDWVGFPTPPEQVHTYVAGRWVEMSVRQAQVRDMADYHPATKWKRQALIADGPILDGGRDAAGNVILIRPGAPFRSHLIIDDSKGLQLLEMRNEQGTNRIKIVYDQDVRVQPPSTDVLAVEDLMAWGRKFRKSNSPSSQQR
ncbi:MAG: hypothetical protein JWO63_3169 [Frankiales bacterium]|nr:hypothetical protein [Frankiales bacterium]